MTKYRYDKHNVLSLLEEKEGLYNKKYVEAVNRGDTEKQKQFLERKSAIQELIIDFENEFE